MKANEQPIPMNLTLNITADNAKELIETIQALASKLGTEALKQPTTTYQELATATEVLRSAVSPEPEPQSNPEPEAEKPAPKKRAAKKTELEPVADTPEPETPAASEPEPEFAFTGDNLADMVKPFSGTEVTKKLKAFKNETLGVETELRKITDTEVLRKLHAKIEELIAAHKAGDDV